MTEDDSSTFDICDARQNTHQRGFVGHLIMIRRLHHLLKQTNRITKTALPLEPIDHARPSNDIPHRHPLEHRDRSAQLAVLAKRIQKRIEGDDIRVTHFIEHPANAAQLPVPAVEHDQTGGYDGVGGEAAGDDLGVKRSGNERVRGGGGGGVDEGREGVGVGGDTEAEHGVEEEEEGGRGVPVGAATVGEAGSDEGVVEEGGRHAPGGGDEEGLDLGEIVGLGFGVAVEEVQQIARGI